MALFTRLKGSKTFYLCLLVLIVSLTTMITRHVEPAHAISMSAVSILVLFLRDSVAKLVEMLSPIKPEPPTPAINSELLIKIIDGSGVLIQDFIAGKIDKAEAEKQALEILLSLTQVAPPEKKS